MRPVVLHDLEEQQQEKGTSKSATGAAPGVLPSARQAARRRWMLPANARITLPGVVFAALSYLSACATAG
ncbi:MAG: hypothetical protein RMK84_08170 [Oscillochloridaceae bacterium]|nr:hypothetical protein [Chloroflexaceae bacterium]MDW8390088.1 hypothetical protein [Oscillochloridaceae bacterium]